MLGPARLHTCIFSSVLLWARGVAGLLEIRVLAGELALLLLLKVRMLLGSLYEKSSMSLQGIHVRIL